MAASTAIHGFGATLSIGAQAVVEIQEISAPNFKRSFHEITHMGSPTGWREFLVGLADAGEVDVRFNWVPDDLGHNAMSGSFRAAASAITITFPNAKTFICTGFATDFSATDNFDGPVTGTCKFKLTGLPTGDGWS